MTDGAANAKTHGGGADGGGRAAGKTAAVDRVSGTATTKATATAAPAPKTAPARTTAATDPVSGTAVAKATVVPVSVLASADTRDEDTVRRFVEQIAMQFADWGFPRMAARVLFALMTADEPGLTAGELAGRLDASAAAISGAVRYLGQLGLVVREPVPGSRRDVYRLADNAWYMSAMAEMSLYSSLIATSESVLDALGAPGSPARSRVTEMRDFLRFLQSEMVGLLDRWNAVRAADRA